MANEYDISRAFKRIENELIDSMMRNMKRHQVEEADLGIEWEQWQAIQLAELEEYRKKHAKLFTGDFKSINDSIDELFRNTANDAQAKEEHALLDRIRKGQFRPPSQKGGFFGLNEGKLEALITATQADFIRAEYALLRQANDQYRKIIFDSMAYANTTNDYAKAVDMATSDFLRKGLNCVQYKNGAKHNIASYAEMAIKTGNKRAYLMGEGNAHDKYGLHTVRVNRRTQACPKCVGFLGRLLIDDVYGGGTRAEATAQGIPTLSDAMQAGFLHPNCKDIYSVYIPGVSKPATPWTQEEIADIVGEYNQDQAYNHALDMQESYQRMAKYSLDPENQQRYTARAKDWADRAKEIRNEAPTPAPQPVPIPTPQPAPQPIPPQTEPFTDDEKEALEWYVSGDGMWINQYLRGNGDFPDLTDTEKELLDLLTSATNKTLEPTDKLYRSVDAKVIFGDLSEDEVDQMIAHLLYGDSQYDKGAYSQGIKKKMETALAKAKGETLVEKGFMSTTVDPDVAINFGDFTDSRNPVVIELDTKGKRVKGADVEFLDIEEDPQKERLLGRNVRYKVNDISVATDADGNKYIKVSAEFIDQAEEAVEETKEFTRLSSADTENREYKILLESLETSKGSSFVDYKKVERLAQAETEEEIIATLSGGDRTKGSCASVGLCYAGRKAGFDVLDFRGGASQDFFSNALNLMTLSDAKGIKKITAQGKSRLTVGGRLLKLCEEGKEYYLVCGRHASIVRRKGGKLQYLELQSSTKSGWTDFDGNPKSTLRTRFGCPSESAYLADQMTYMIDLQESDFETDEFRTLMGYINTSVGDQRKGKGGTIK